MAPNLLGSTATLFLEATQQDIRQSKTPESVPSTSKSTAQTAQTRDEPKYKWRIVWRNVIAFLYLHIGALYGFYLFFAGAKFLTLIWTLVVAALGAVGVTAGAHRLWAHRAYKAKWPMRLILMIFQTLAFQNHLSEWVRDHRVHHKFTDTDADPHNAKRGFFFSHMGWLLVRKHRDVIEKGATVDVSDLESDPIVVWQRRLYVILMPVFCFLIPTWVPCRFWGETGMNSWYCATVFRYTLSLNLTWLVNSAAHIWGTKPYDDSISPTDNVRIALGAFGEGWHNYHHVFPWDYKAAELGNYRANFTTAFIDFFAWLGQAYDLKTVPLNMIKKRAARTGDGTRIDRDEHYGHSHEGAIWGWGDIDMHTEDILDAQITNKTD
ncbi:acyl-CoA Delta-9 desaturase [Neodiprion pinetum]|uniref:acyl-CoA Delta-9 desaturase-like n=1 Tax=Neodiprion fabricii TaxID=2872261 RepID=UPI001ED946CD|nr:acyl-CoA Delta-9 desaturase-like [Neodiprion fabricii]XP_046435915.1 acyl-CoA Delta-9 desaturase-like [Neodiprion fabricii]XP_046435916.1 acyl-CoA Delta-9 desaturase-like [Neodiprion fabricii]XP_046489807.1 acyl-CoA Delta-9 desaturase-like [Neodiprion pinetum]XP_046489815.1 acyl-CoA Delta-9 desaturase-like [Neodiprion pinetum]XP_046489820.1 acyl-CoA Delta-9 desaturase-like [Neodiprion pinetum]XP_046629795.1 acyl-CoA Delta-9 desaturase-like [Neodiprion virginianus]XP_046629796.1 acyl-CoA D